MASELAHRALGLSGPDDLTVYEAASLGEWDVVAAKLSAGVAVDRINARRGLKPTALGYAALAGRLDIVKLLLAAGADPAPPGTQNITPLNAAVKGGHLAIVQELLKSGGQKCARHLSRYGRTGLCEAARRGDTAAAKCLLAAGADPAWCDGDEPPPVWSAAKGGHVEVVDLLLSTGEDVALSKVLYAGRNCAHAAAQGGNMRLMRLAVEAGADIDTKCGARNSTLEYAAMGGSLDVINFVVGRLSDPRTEVREHKRWHTSPMHLAARHGHGPALRRLAEIGGGCVGADETGMTVLMTAARSGSVDCIEAALSLCSAEDAWAVTREGKTAIWCACASGNASAIRRLASIDVARAVRMLKKSRACLQGIAWKAPMTSGSLEAVEAVLSLGLAPDLEAIGEGNWRTALHAAADRGWPAMVRVLLAKGANPATTTPDGFSAVIAAARRGCVDSVNALLETGRCRPVAQWGARALYDSARKGSVEMLLRLLELGAEDDPSKHAGDSSMSIAAGAWRGSRAAVALLERKVAQGVPPAWGDSWRELFGLAEQGRTYALRRFLHHGANPHCLDPRGKSLLMAALDNQNLEMIELLLAVLGPEAVQHVDDEGVTVLGSIGWDVSVPVLRRLLEAGADPTVRSKGSSILAKVARSGCADAVDVLLSFPGVEASVAGSDGAMALGVLVSRHSKSSAGTLRVGTMLLERGADPFAVKKEDHPGGRMRHRYHEELLAQVAAVKACGRGQPGRNARWWRRKRLAMWLSAVRSHSQVRGSR